MLDLYREQFDDEEARRSQREPFWLRDARRAAFARFAATGLPDTRDEEWRYTNVAPLGRTPFHLSPAAPPLAAHGADAARLAERVRALALPGAHVLVFVNGRHAAALSQCAGLPPEARATSLARAVAEDDGPVRALFAADGQIEQRGFSALNAAFWRDGAYIELGSGASVAAPIHLLFISTQAQLATHPRNVVHAGAGARATIVEHHAGLADAPYLTNASTRIVVGAGADIEHVALQHASARAYHVAQTSAAQGPASRFACIDIALGALLARHDIAVALGGEHGAATLTGLCLAAGRQHIDHHSRIEHAAPRCRSRELYKGVLHDAARAVFHGHVVVQRGAWQSDALQSNQNLLLSPQAEVDTKPQLEIYADDVACRHGATVGQLDPGQLFYLRTRGLDESAARAMLTLGFAREVVDAVGFVPLRELVAALVGDKLAAPSVPPSENS